VRVNCVIPGWIATPSLDRYPQTAWHALRHAADDVPLRRHGTAAEVSAAVVFLLSDMAAYVTAAEIPVDGGLHAGARSVLFEPPRPRNMQIFDGFHRETRARILDGDERG
jgi:citronellol/citronellal dehydrogenase